MINNRLEEEVRKLMIKKSEDFPVIKKGTPRLNELKEGESQKRFVNDQLIEYVKYNNELYETVYPKASSKHAKSRFDVEEGLLSTPNYDSGWVAVEADVGQNYDFYHYLNTKYLIMVGFFKKSLGGLEYIFNLNLHTFTDDAQSGNKGHGVTVFMQTADKINLAISDDEIFVHENTATFGGGYKDEDSGHIRLFCWKFNPTATED